MVCQSDTWTNVLFGVEILTGPRNIVLEFRWEMLPVVLYMNMSVLTHSPDGATYNAAITK